MGGESTAGGRRVKRSLGAIQDSDFFRDVRPTNRSMGITKGSSNSGNIRYTGDIAEARTEIGRMMAASGASRSTIQSAIGNISPHGVVTLHNSISNTLGGPADLSRVGQLRSALNTGRSPTPIAR